MGFARWKGRWGWLLGVLVAVVVATPAFATEIVAGHTRYESRTKTYYFSQGVRLTSDALIPGDTLEVEAEELVFSASALSLRVVGETKLRLLESGIELTGQDLVYEGRSGEGRLSQVKAVLPARLGEEIRRGIADTASISPASATPAATAARRSLAMRGTLYVLSGELRFSRRSGGRGILNFEQVRLSNTPREETDIFVSLRRLTLVQGEAIYLEGIALHFRGIKVFSWPSYRINLRPTGGGFDPGLPRYRSDRVVGREISLSPSYSVGDGRLFVDLNYTTRRSTFAGYRLVVGEAERSLGELALATGRFTVRDREGGSILLSRDWEVELRREFVGGGWMRRLMLLGAAGRLTEISFPEEGRREVEVSRRMLGGEVDLAPLPLTDRLSLNMLLFARLYDYSGQGDDYRVGGGRVSLDYRTPYGSNFVGFTLRERTGPTPLVSDRSFLEKELNVGLVGRVSRRYLLGMDYRLDMERNRTDKLKLSLYYLFPNYNLQFFYEAVDQTFGVTLGLLGTDHL